MALKTEELQRKIRSFLKKHKPAGRCRTEADIQRITETVHETIKREDPELWQELQFSRNKQSQQSMIREVVRTRRRTPAIV